MFTIFLKKLKYIGLFSIIVGLIMANFLHASLMSEAFEPNDKSVGACHTHESNQPDQSNAEKDILPCCADKKDNSAPTLFALFDFKKLLHPATSLTFLPIPKIESELLPSKSPYPPNQVALDKIILRI